eukprot:5295320-Pyramimonas_sp.AAC.1
MVSDTLEAGKGDELQHHIPRHLVGSCRPALEASPRPQEIVHGDAHALGRAELRCQTFQYRLHLPPGPVALHPVFQIPPKFHLFSLNII